jgi:hypothetical protein
MNHEPQMNADKPVAGTDEVKGQKYNRPARGFAFYFCLLQNEPKQSH